MKLIKKNNIVSKYNFLYLGNDLDINKKLIEADEDFKNGNFLSFNEFKNKSLEYKNNLFRNV